MKKRTTEKNVTKRTPDVAMTKASTTQTGVTKRASGEGKGKGETDSAMEMLRQASQQGRLTLGLDLGDQYSGYCSLDHEGKVLIRNRVVTRPAEIDRLFGAIPKMRVAMEVGTHRRG